MKICTQCNNPIEESAERCPYCFYEFPKKKVEKPKTEPQKPVQSKTASTQTKSTTVATDNSTPPPTIKTPPAPKTKKKGNLGKAIVIAIIVYGVIKLYGVWSEAKYALSDVLDLAKDKYVEQSTESERGEESSSNSEAESIADSTIASSDEAMQESAQEGMQESVQESTEEYVEELPGYILPYSDSMYYTREDLVGFSKEELRIARNEIYARHGRTFNDANLQAYFDAQDWYSGYIAPGDFSDSVFNEYEVYNKDLIVAYEKELQ